MVIYGPCFIILLVLKVNVLFVKMLKVEIWLRASCFFLIIGIVFLHICSEKRQKVTLKMNVLQQDF
jgi:hypothetical protein